MILERINDDGEAFIYTDGLIKYVIHPNYEIKINRNKSKRVVFVTATRLIGSET